MKVPEKEEERLAREAVARIRTWAENRKRVPGADSFSRMAIKFCGGCNPLIDRGQIARSVRENLTGLVRWVSAEEEADLLLIISGCLIACIDRPEITEKAAEYLSIAGARIAFIERDPGKKQRRSS